MLGAQGDSSGFMHQESRTICSLNVCISSPCLPFAGFSFNWVYVLNIRIMLTWRGWRIIRGYLLSVLCQTSSYISVQASALGAEYRIQKKPIHLGMTNSVVKRRAKKAEFPLMQIDLKACREMWRGKVIPQLQCQHWQSCCWAEAGCGGAGWQRSLLLISHLGRRYLATTHSKNTFTFLLSFIPAQLARRICFSFFKVFFFLPYPFPLHFM